jgi:hypothetical protein
MINHKLIYRHNAVRDILFRLGQELGVTVAREPLFPTLVRGSEGRRPDVVFRNWEGDQDLFVDVVGSSSLALSNLGEFVPGGAATKAAARKNASYREILNSQPSSVVFRAFSFETLGGLHTDALGLISRLQGLVHLAALTHDDTVFYSVAKRVSFVIAKAVGRQLSSRLPWWGGSSLP